MILVKEGNWNVIQEEPPAAVTTEWTRKYEKAQATISLSVEDNQIVHICKCKNAKEMWKELQKVHARNNLCNKLYLLRKLYQSKLEGKIMSDYIKETLELVKCLRGVGETIEDFHVAALLLGGLPDGYSSLVTALDARPDDQLTLEYVKGKLMDEYNRKEESSTEVALNTNFRKGRNLSECYHCHKKGHFKKNCFLYKKYLSKKDYKKENQCAKTAVYEEENDGSDFCFVVGSNNKDEWLLDSGVTSHYDKQQKLSYKF